MENRKNIDAFSYLRVFATFGVILLHVAYSSYLLFKDSITVGEGSALLSITNALRFAVPCFVGVTGALLLNPEKSIDIKTVWKKYILRIFLALLLFSAVFFIFDLIMDGETLNGAYILNAVKEFYTAKGWAHLWYMYLLIGLYVLLPFYKMIAEKASDRELEYLLAAYFIFISVLPLTKYFGWEPGFYIHTATVYPLYLFMGYAIYNKKLVIKPAVAVLIFVLCEALTVTLNCISNSRGIENLSVFWDYQSPVTVLASGACFSLFCNLGDMKDGVIRKCIMSVDKCTLGIYLFHMMIVRLVLRYWNFNPLNYGSVAGVIAFSFAVTLVTYAVIRLLKFIPGLKKIL